MSHGTLVCGHVVESFDRGYLVELVDGTTQSVYTDDNTLGNGPAHLGEHIMCWVEGQNRASVLTRALYVPAI